MGEAIETYCEDGEWRNRMRGREPLPGTYGGQAAAVEVGRDEARIRGVAHVIRRIDGTVAERNRYPRRSGEIPG
ncbi:hypothetical protein GCM10009795_061680 [Nocardioides hankookensis]|uniref:DUF2188 domain-containing protein n=1 Tax=Nocardioides hankookensis TaxID=443157 RepID=A0ABW1LN15_9ACTN